jgi:ArsR family transcriptional regulator, arsenate/arsenite/antimonite-responsive transcriptional repressor
VAWVRPHEIDGGRYARYTVIDGCQYVEVGSLPTIADSCRPLLGAPLKEQQAENLAAALKVLADPARLRLLNLIQTQPEGEACVCHLTEPLGLSQPTVSHHLKVLHNAGLLERDKRGSWVHYRVVPEAIRALSELLR